MIKVGVIGVGSMGENHARVYFHSDDAQLVAVADSSTEQVAKVARRYNCVAYTDYRELLARSDIDAVSVAVPTSMHHQVSLDVLRHKKHLLLEKPIAHSEQEATEIIAAAKQSGVKFMVGHIERFNPAVIELKERLLKGELGEIYHLDVQRIGPFPSRITDVGVIIDLSVHDLDIIDYIMNARPVRIYAETQQKLHPQHEDSVTAMLRFANGAVGVLNINYLSPTKTRQLRVFGKKGMFLINYLDQELYFYENVQFIGDSWNSVAEGEMRKMNITKKEPLQAEIEAFLRSILKNQEPLVSGEQGLRVLSTANKLLASARQQKIIEL